MLWFLVTHNILPPPLLYLQVNKSLLEAVSCRQGSSHSGSK